LEELNSGIGKFPATDTTWWRGNKKKGISRLTSRFTDSQSGEQVESSGARIIAVSSIISEFLCKLGLFGPVQIRKFSKIKMRIRPNQKWGN
jgi:hypothetical protein